MTARSVLETQPTSGLLVTSEECAYVRLEQGMEEGDVFTEQEAGRAR